MNITRRSWQAQARFALLLAILALGALFSLTSCGASTPSESAARKVYEHTNSRIKDGEVKLRSFRKTNGKMMEVLGSKIYQLDYEAELECLKDDDSLIVFGERCKKGDVITDTGSTIFEETERGWKGVDGEIY